MIVSKILDDPRCLRWKIPVYRHMQCNGHDMVPAKCLSLQCEAEARSCYCTTVAKCGGYSVVLLVRSPTAFSWNKAQDHMMDVCMSKIHNQDAGGLPPEI